MGKIAIEGMEFTAYHGLYDFEQKNGGKYSVDVYIDFDSEKVRKSDEVMDTINYEKILAIVTQEMEESSKMIEHVADRIMDYLIAEFTAINAIKLRITKHNPPLESPVARVFFELEKKLKLD